MNDIVIPDSFGAVSQRFAGSNAPADDDLGAGVQGGYGLIGYRGKVWSIRYRGDEHQLMRDDGDGPRGSIEVVILKASSHIAKIWYEQGYTEGSSAAPDCFSTNGITPDIGAAKKQSQACASCARNAWGSRITPQGKQGKECSDSKRLAITPVGDLKNELYGGPLLLRVPAASLQEMAQYANKIQALGYPYYGIATRISFDPDEAYPKFKIDALRALTDEEADTVLLLREDPQVVRILAEGTEVAAPAPAPVEPAQLPQEELPFGTPQQKAPESAPVLPQPAVEGSGFGAGAAQELNKPTTGEAVTQPATAAEIPVATDAQAEPAANLTNGEVIVGDTDFDKELDAKLSELLPS